MSEKDETRPWPEGEPAVSAEEQAAASQLADELDQALAGRLMRPSAQQGSLAAALMLRASAAEQHLHPARRSALVDEAIQSAQPRAIAAARPRAARRWAPTLALAASLLLLVGASLMMLVPARKPSSRASIPITLRSRPSDELLGRPFSAEERGAASQRLDLVFADRLAGYRRLVLGEEADR